MRPAQLLTGPISRRAHTALRTTVALRTTARAARREPVAARPAVAVETAVPTAPASALQEWKQVDDLVVGVLGSYHLRPGLVPSSAPRATLPTAADAHLQSTAPLVLYRDTNGWCPYCARVQFALEEKGVPYDSVPIDLGAKPDWYVELVPTKLVPAARFRDGGVLWESKDVLMALEERFPERPLLPTEPAQRDQALQLMADLEKHDLPGAGFRLMVAGGVTERDESRLGEFRDAFLAEAAWLEGVLARSGGPFILGEQLSLLDVLWAPLLTRVADSLPMLRGVHLHDAQAWPRVTAWLDAVNTRPSFQAVRMDATSALRLLHIFGVKADGAPLQNATAAELEARREAAGKLSRNLDAVLDDLLRKSGADAWTLPAGQADTSVRSAASAALLRVASALLTGLAGPPPATAAERALGAVAVTYLRSRVCSPRDMSAAGAEQLRSACDQVLLYAY